MPKDHTNLDVQEKIKKALRELVRLVDPTSGQPNSDPLWLLARDIGIMRLNQKNYGYELARALGSSAMSSVPVSPPEQVLGWRASTQSDIESDWAAYWCNELGIRPVYHRKVWELAYVLHNLWLHGAIAQGRKGLGFGCGQEPLPSYLAAKGVEIVATDLAPNHADAKAWRNTNQHTEDLDKIWQPHLVDRTQFDQHVSLAYVDMNAIPSSLSDFDFCWSICALEHLGSIKKGLDFIRNSLNAIRPGGISVHTTEFNFSPGSTIDNWPVVLFQQEHFESIANLLRQDGNQVDPISFDIGRGALDRFIDLPPYGDDMPGYMKSNEEFPSHLKLSIDGIAATCFGMVIRKAS